MLWELPRSTFPPEYQSLPTHSNLLSSFYLPQHRGICKYVEIIVSNLKEASKLQTDLLNDRRMNACLLTTGKNQSQVDWHADCIISCLVGDDLVVVGFCKVSIDKRSAKGKQYSYIKQFVVGWMVCRSSICPISVANIIFWRVMTTALHLSLSATFLYNNSKIKEWRRMASLILVMPIYSITITIVVGTSGSLYQAGFPLRDSPLSIMSSNIKKDACNISAHHPTTNALQITTHVSI